jgi:hypothetical protein
MSNIDYMKFQVRNTAFLKIPLNSLSRNASSRPSPAIVMGFDKLRGASRDPEQIGIIGKINIYCFSWIPDLISPLGEMRSGMTVFGRLSDSL